MVLVPQVVYSWSATRGGAAVNLPAAAVGAKNLRLDPVDLVSFVRGSQYVFTLTASFEGSQLQATSSMVRVFKQFQAVGTELIGRVAACQVHDTLTSRQLCFNNAAYMFSAHSCICKLMSSASLVCNLMPRRQ